MRMKIVPVLVVACAMSSYVPAFQGQMSCEDKLIASDGETGDSLGWSVAHRSGTALLGSINDDDGGLNAGAVYVFELSGGIWVESQKLTATDALDGDQFGFSVSLSAGHALIGSPGSDALGANSGAAYIFERIGSTWVEVEKIVSGDGQQGGWLRP